MPVDAQGIVDAAEEILKTVPDVYDDLAKPAVVESGKAIGRIPRAINAALSSLDIWIMNREYNVARTKKLLEIELSNIDPKKIVPPEPYVAIPAMQAIAYSMDSQELRNMYAKLLAKAMTGDTKDSVHPGFVEIIKQMSPLDAENLVLFGKDDLPVAEYRQMYVSTNFITLQTNVFLENMNCTDLSSQAISLSSLKRLGLIEIDYSFWLAENDGSVSKKYDAFSETAEFRDYCKHISPPPSDGFLRPRDDGLVSEIMVVPGRAQATPLGHSFISICY